MLDSETKQTKCWMNAAGGTASEASSIPETSVVPLPPKRCFQMKLFITRSVPPAAYVFQETK